jgi:hypothetical protein
MYILNKEFDFLRSKNFKLSRKTKGNSLYNCDILGLVIFVRGGHCYCSPRASKNPSYATDQNTQFSVLNEPTLVDVAVYCLINGRLISIWIFALLQDDVSVRGAGCALAAAFQFESRKI